MSYSSKGGMLNGKEHYHILDGLRGVAALAVVLFHYLEWIHSDFSENIIGHGFLAVDFFFCLSGFVIAYAYDSRISQMGLKQFFVSRLFRLHPLVIAGAILGLIAMFADPFANQAEGQSIGFVLLIFLSSVLMIPLPIMEERGFNLFSLNAPSWSLFWEYIANVLYGLILVRLSRKVLWVFLVIAAAALLWVSHSAGNLLGGWSGGTFADGGIRMMYSFLAGLLIFRSGWILKIKLGFVVLSILLFAAFMMPWFSHNWLVEWVMVILYFPLVVSLGAGASVSGWLKKLCIFMGKISYPLYMTHYAFMWWFGNYYTTQNPPQEYLPWIIGLGTVAMVFFAWLVMFFYDEPVRKFLNRIKAKSL
nr:acyltransferase [uncultured Carboxylicivirga sp.]